MRIYPLGLRFKLRQASRDNVRGFHATSMNVSWRPMHLVMAFATSLGYVGGQYTVDRYSYQSSRHIPFQLLPS